MRLDKWPKTAGIRSGSWRHVALEQEAVLKRNGGKPAVALIVEDDRGESELAALVLGELDLEVIQVASGEDALTCLCDRAEEIGVVLVDIHLEGEMTGIALTERICVLWPTLSVLVTSGDLNAGQASLPPRATFIPKPWRPLDIVAAAEKAARADHSVRGLQL